MNISLYPLGKTDIRITPIGLGCWQFSGGKGLVGGYWKAIDQDDVNRIVQATLDGGVNWFDTAEAYGMGQSEEALSTALEGATRPDGVVVATKWMPVLRFAGSIRNTFPYRKQHLSPFAIDLHQVHNPASFSSVEREMSEMADLVDAGSIRSVGVSNFSADRMRKASEALERRGLTLASNQVRYSMLDRQIESNGILETAKELGVSIIAYSPLAQGILTGKFHRSEEERARLSGPRRFLPRFRASGLESTAPLVRRIEEIGETHGASAAQVSLAWLIRRSGESVVAIPGASSVSQAESNAAAMRVILADDEIAELDELSQRVAG